MLRPIPSVTLLLLATFAAFVAVSSPTPALGVNYTAVASEADGINVNGVCSLREAVKASRENTAVDTCPAGSAVAVDVIKLEDEAVYTLSADGATDDTGDLDLTVDGSGDLEITGNGATVDADAIDRVFDIKAGATPIDVSLSDMRITGGLTTTSGGGVYIYNANVSLSLVTVDNNYARVTGAGVFGNNNSSLTILDSELSNNEEDPAGTGNFHGGGVGANGELDIQRTLISGNSADSGGGVHSSSTTTITRSQIIDNQAIGAGPAINTAGGTIAVSNTTVSGNTAPGTVLTIYQADAAFYNVTIARNTGNVTIYVDADRDFEVANTIIAENTVPTNCGSASLVSLGHNLEDADTCELDAAGDITDGDADLEDIANNGGNTLTHALGGASQAIDAGDDAICAADPVNGVDQRGVARPIDGDNDSLGHCDIGAFEAPEGTVATPTPTPTPTPSPTPTPTPEGQTPTPTPTPIGQTPTPTPVLTPTPTPTPEGQTPTPTSASTPTPTPVGGTPAPTPTATPSPTPGGDLTQGDLDCDGDNDAVDALVQLQSIAGLDYNQQPDCPAIGSDLLQPASEPNIFGDVDCDGDNDAVDALKQLQFVAAIPFTQNDPCPAIGDPLT